MKILAHAISNGEIRVQVKHGIWPFVYYRTYCGSADFWRRDTTRLSPRPAVRAELTRWFNEHFEVVR